ncbi:hypothetical protein JOD64_001370 [Micromonospora luteifusca]|uniref:Uncharacterized protein n=1 Tax=Micromonospora luteifusca TaxID=709860 RepID=A0ABS2LQK1_9ACTN|nr:pyridoxamine 5'-phosphate oxidase family protein [Micromonospora luteifusca]MBM7490148.1 hypothetical protein [Micromonospora luteifusca]
MTPALAASAFDSLRLDAVPDQEALRRVYELPSDAAVRKQMTELTEQTRRLVGCPSLVLVASVDAEGNCDISPRGGPAGFVDTATATAPGTGVVDACIIRSGAHLMQIPAIMPGITLTMRSLHGGEGPCRPISRC